MDKIKKSSPFLLWIHHLCCLTLIFIAIFLYADYQCLSIFIIAIGALLFMSSVVNDKHIHKCLQYFILCSDEIIESKHKRVQVIDGEGDISLLSHKLYILNQRYEQMSQTILEDQKHLQEYMENIAHQLKIPITIMKLNEEMLMSNHQNHLLVNIYQQTNKLNMLVDELLKLATLESNAFLFDIKDYKIDELVNDIEDNLLELCLQKDMKLVWHQNTDTIACDKKWMIEALENIIKNCIENNEKSQITISIEKNNQLLKITIQDKGRGLPTSEIEHLFDRFHKGKDSQGYGLGLAMSREIVEKHHGMIQAKNDHGAVFEIVLPVILAKKKL